MLESPLWSSQRSSPKWTNLEWTAQRHAFVGEGHLHPCWRQALEYVKRHTPLQGSAATAMCVRWQAATDNACSDCPSLWLCNQGFAACCSLWQGVIASRVFRGQGFFIREIISMHDHEVVRLPPVSAARFRACRAKSGDRKSVV